MYIYKKHGKKLVLAEYLNTCDEYEVEEILIKIFRETIHKKILPKINIKSIDDYKIYYIECPLVVLFVSIFPLSKDILSDL